MFKPTSVDIARAVEEWQASGGTVTVLPEEIIPAKRQVNGYYPNVCDNEVDMWGEGDD